MLLGRLDLHIPTWLAIHMYYKHYVVITWMHATGLSEMYNEAKQLKAYVRILYLVDHEHLVYVCNKLSYL